MSDEALDEFRDESVPELVFPSSSLSTLSAEDFCDEVCDESVTSPSSLLTS